PGGPEKGFWGAAAGSRWSRRRPPAPESSTRARCTPRSYGPHPARVRSAEWRSNRERSRLKTRREEKRSLPLLRPPPLSDRRERRDEPELGLRHRERPEAPAGHLVVFPRSRSRRLRVGRRVYFSASAP